VCKADWSKPAQLNKVGEEAATKDGEQSRGTRNARRGRVSGDDSEELDEVEEPSPLKPSKRGKARARDDEDDDNNESEVEVKVKRKR